MSKDIMKDALEGELRFWPGVTLHIENGGKHRRAHFTFGGDTKWVGVSITPADKQFAPRKAIREMQRLLESMGAARVDRILNKKEREQMATANDVKFGISSGSISVVVPKGNKLYERFVKEDKPLGHWKLELRSNPDLKGDPFIAVVPVVLPPGQSRMKGASAPNLDRKSGQVTVWVRPHIFPDVAKIGEFRTTPVKVRESGREIVLELPKTADRQPPILRGEQRLEALTRPEPQPEPAVEQAPELEPVIEQRSEQPAAAGADMLAQILGAMQVKPKSTERLLFSTPERPLTIERCVAFLNSQVQSKTKRNLRLEVDHETGLLSYVERGGPKY